MDIARHKIGALDLKRAGRRVLYCAFTCACFLLCQSVSVAAEPMGRIGISEDKRGFVLKPSGAAFVPWGFNYAPRNELLEDHWDHNWDEISGDFSEMKDLGANVVRVHLQFGKFMTSADTPNSAALARLKQVLSLAEKQSLYLDITGLACYRTSDNPKWYDPLTEQERWAAQQVFWEAVAEACTTSPAVFCYDLINEPLVPGERREAGKWYSGVQFGGFDYLQFVSLDPAERKREEVAKLWVRTMVNAIRKRDKIRLITVGQLPWEPPLGHFSGFLPELIAPEVDFLSVHVYPKGGKLEEATECVEKFSLGKPLVIEETFPLNCGIPDLETFLLQTRANAAGWMGHYFGTSLEELERRRSAREMNIPDAIMLEWLKLFKKLRPGVAAASPSP